MTNGHEILVDVAASRLEMMRELQDLRGREKAGLGRIAAMEGLKDCQDDQIRRLRKCVHESHERELGLAIRLADAEERIHRLEAWICDLVLKERGEDGT